MDTQTATTCPKCGDDVLPAMARCRTCGQHLSCDVPRKPDGRPQDHRLGSSSSLNLDAMYEKAGIQETQARPQSTATADSPNAGDPPAQNPTASFNAATGNKPPNAAESQSNPVSCSGCGRSVDVPVSLVGKRVKCPACGAQLPVPGVAASSSGETSAVSRQRRGREPSRGDAREQFQAAVETALRARPPELNPEGEARHTLRRRELRRLKQALANVTFGIPSQSQLDTANAALERLRQSDDSRVSRVLLDHVADLPPPLARASLRMLGDRREPAAFEPLMRMLATADEQTLSALLPVCGQVGDQHTLRPLLAAAAGFPRQRSVAVDAMVSLGAPAVPLLVRVAQKAGRDEDTGIRCAAIEALERLAEPRTAAHLSKLVKDADPEVRLHAVKALGAIEHDSTLRPLVAALSDADASVRIAAATGLARRPNPKLAPCLVKALQDPCADVQRQAVKGLGLCGEPSVAARLHPLLASDDEELALGAAESMARLGDETVVPDLLDRLQREMTNPGSERGAAKIIDALRRLGDDRAVLPLVALLGHPQDTIRGRAAEALGQIGDPAAVESLVDLLQREFSPTAQAAAAKALGELRDPQAIPALEHALGQSAHVRSRAIIALGEIGGPRAMRSLLKLTKDPAGTVRYHATTGLAKIGDRSAISALEPLTIDKDEMVRRGAIKALQELGDDRTEEEIVSSAQDAVQVRPGKERRQWWRPASLVNVAPDVLVEVGSGQLPVYIGTLLLVVVVMTGVIWMGATSGTASLPRGFVANVAISPDGRRVANNRGIGLFELWDVDRGEVVSTEERLPGQLTFAGETLVAIGDGIQLLQLDGFDVTSQLPIEASGSRAVAFSTSPLGQRLVTASSDGVCVCWNIQSREGEWSLQIPDLVPLAVAVNEDGSMMCATTDQSDLLVWDSASAELLHEFQFDQNSPSRSVRFDTSGRYLAAGTDDGTVLLFDLEGNWRRPEIRQAGPFPTILHFGDGLRLVVQCGGAVYSWPANADESRSFPVPLEGGVVMSATPDGSKIAAGGDESSEIHVYDVETGALIATLDSD